MNGVDERRIQEIVERVLQRLGPGGPGTPMEAVLKAAGSIVVAIDAVGAGVGEVVLYASGSSARQTKVTKDRPVDATIMAIVDSIELEGRQTYTK